MVRNTPKKQYDILVNDPRVLSREDTAYKKIIAPYRKICGLPALSVDSSKPVNFSGIWVFNEEKSSLDNSGAGNLPYKLEIKQEGNELNIKYTIILEYADNRITEENLMLDGSENISEFLDSPRITTAGFSENKDSLCINSTVTFQRGDRTFDMITHETWTLQNNGKELIIHQYSSSPRGERNIAITYDRQLL